MFRHYNGATVAYMDWLEQSVAAVLAEGSIGEPVAARLFVALGEDHGELERTAGAALRMTGRWLGRPLARLYAQGSAREGQISVQATFGGRMALLSAELVRPGGCSEVRLLVLGQKGALTHEDIPGADGLPIDAAPLAAPGEVSLIRRSLQSAGPVEG